LEKNREKKCLGAQTPQRMRWFPCLQDCLLTLTWHLAYMGTLAPGWQATPALSPWCQGIFFFEGVIFFFWRKKWKKNFVFSLFFRSFSLSLYTQIGFFLV
jgi:hypothetical protein